MHCTIQCLLGSLSHYASTLNPKTLSPQCLLGSLSYNGQRCTALKLILVHNDILMDFTKRFIAKVENMKAGLPWQKGTDITPLPEPGTRPWSQN